MKKIKYTNTLNNDINILKYGKNYGIQHYYKMYDLCVKLLKNVYKTYSDSKINSLVNIMCGLDLYENIDIFNNDYRISLNGNNFNYNIIVNGNNKNYKITKKYIYEY